MVSVKFIVQTDNIFLMTGLVHSKFNSFGGLVG
jgi:hypothetical protein